MSILRQSLEILLRVEPVVAVELSKEFGKDWKKQLAEEIETAFPDKEPDSVKREDDKEK